MSQCLGGEAADEGDPAIVLDLQMRGKEQLRGLLSRNPADGAFTVRGVHKAIPWSGRISRLEPDGWLLGFRSPIAREYLALNIVLLPALRRLLLDRGVAPLACAAFEEDGGATLIAGLTGRGKSTLLLGAVERGARLIVDEWLGVGEDAQVSPVLRSLLIRREALALAPRTLRRLSLRRRSSLRMAQVTAYLTRRRLQPHVYVPPAELGITPVEGAWPRLRRVFWLESEPGMEPGVCCEPMALHDAIDQLALVQTAHHLLYGDLGLVLDLVRGGSAHTDYAARWRRILERGLEGAALHRLRFPARDGILPQVLEHVLERG